MISTIVLATCLLALAVGVSSTALDDYVWKHDPNYAWVDMGHEWSWKGSISNRSYTAYTLNMTSQQWLTDADFAPNSPSKSIWWHYLVVIVPEEVSFTRNATLWITGGSVTSGFPSPSDEDIVVSAALATSVGMITGALFQIPDQKVIFAQDPLQKARSEDAIIAYTWDHFLKDPSQPDWLVRFPMVKASLRAMDTMNAFIQEKFPTQNYNLDSFAVAGASKRGWTTWLVGAVDPLRVKIIIPIVLDAINFVKVMHHQYQLYGGWSFALEDYTDMNITQRMDSDNMKLLQREEDPFFYRQRLTMPKFVINAGMDEFQQPDDLSLWWSQMPGPKHFLMLPNVEHSLITGIFAAVPAVAAFLAASLNRDPLPRLDWTLDPSTGEIVATLGKEGALHSAKVWSAVSCGSNAWDNNTPRRDFRVAHLDSPCACGPSAEGYCANLKAVWDQKDVQVETVNGKRTLRALVPSPSEGHWSAFFLDLRFKSRHLLNFNFNDLIQQSRRRRSEDLTPGGKIALDHWGGFPRDLAGFLAFTTEVSVLPMTVPYEDCQGEACGVRLV